MQTDAPTIWTAKEIAEWLRLCERHVSERLTHQRGFPKPLPVGKKRRWFKDDVIAWASTK